MSSKKTKRSKQENKKEDAPLPSFLIPKTNLKKETVNILIGLLFFLIGILLTLGMFNGGGLVGTSLAHGIKKLLGALSFLAPLLFFYLGYKKIRSQEVTFSPRYVLGGLLFIFSFLGLISVSIFLNSGGMLGEIISSIFGKLFGNIGSIFFMSVAFIASILIISNEKPNFSNLFRRVQNLFMTLWGSVKVPTVDFASLKLPKTYSPEEETIDEEEVEEVDEDTDELENDEKERAHALSEKKDAGFKKIQKEEVDETEEDESLDIPKKKRKVYTSYTLPPLSLLEKDRGKPNTGDVKANANIIKRTLSNFGIEVEMDEITVGPTVTRYALKPAEGVKLSRIVALQSDLSLALAAHPIRIEAPIPGKSLVGIEIPNKSKSIIGFASLLSEPQFKNDPKPLIVAIGKNINGVGRFVNLAKMPHGLIAGATGSGKSVTIHAVVTSLLYRNSPDDLKFIFIDPKRVELTAYNGIPHLLTPVITDPKKAILALKWAAKEMEKRYDILETNKVRDISSYHENIYPKLAKQNPEAERMPYIVIVIDELADIMQAYPRELESGIVRLAQMSRAVGIHLILSTQRPSVNVITGLIKANIPARVALQVASQIDSRTIIDQPGAEKLLGAGDMLYSSGEMASPERIQCAYISEDEVRKVVSFIKENNDGLTDEINLSPSAIGNDNSIFGATLDSNDGDDELYEDARQTVIESGKASTSFLQRKLGIGYARAARLIDILEERGVVGPGNGAKPRDVLERSVSEESQDFV